MLDITTIILTYNEEIHIRRCLENVCQISKKVFVVDSLSTDRTVEICQGFMNVDVVFHKYPGNQAEQFNWALDNLKIDTAWVLRMDADEYLLPELVDELEKKIPSLPNDINGIEFKRRHIFMGKWMKHGIYPAIIMRMFRTGYGRCEDRIMDEHIVISNGKSIVMDNDFCDHSLIDVTDFCKKHLNYARREATVVLYENYGLKEDPKNNFSDIDSNEHLGRQAEEKHLKKNQYNRMPLFWRSFAYFLFRYFLKGGILDGVAGFIFNFLQGWWYRFMVDVNIYDAISACGIKNAKHLNIAESDRTKLIEYIKNTWSISL